MKKFVFLIFFTLLFAANLDFSPCYQKYKNIEYSIPVSKNLRITFYKPKKYLYYDPFTGLYVFKYKNTKYIEMSSNYKLGWWMAGIKKGKVYGGTLAEDMNFLNLAKLSVKVPKTSVISDLFCRAYGIGRGDGFLRGDYVKHFAKYGYWGDIGIEVDENMVVKYVDPFYVNGIRPGDRIIKINLKKADVENFEKFVILGKIGHGVVIETNRGSYPLVIRKKIYNFTPLMHFGIVVNKNLYITKLPENIIKNRYIKPPVKLIAINGKKVKTFEELKKVLSFYKNVTITIEKNGIRLTIPLRK
ncbi:DUF7488 domain-containing protein [Caminibacter sp.]